jgi:hypothetical protein
MAKGRGKKPSFLQTPRALFLQSEEQFKNKREESFFLMPSLGQ